MMHEVEEHETACRAPLHTTSSLLEVMNNCISSSDAHGRVEIRKRDNDGKLLQPSTEDIKKLDSDMALQQVAGALQGLQPEERLSWAIKWRENGNAQFAKGDYATAANTYLQCLTALEDMTNDSTKRQITLPVLCNLAACALVERRYSNSQELCTMALEQDANSIKALRRRADARVALGDFSGARADLKRALDVATGPKDVRSIMSSIKSMRAERKKTQKDREDLKRRYAFGMGSLYHDKPSPPVPRLETQGVTWERAKKCLVLVFVIAYRIILQWWSRNLPLRAAADRKQRKKNM